jgi:hypothetical protein
VQGDGLPIRVDERPCIPSYKILSGDEHGPALPDGVENVWWKMNHNLCPILPLPSECRGESYGPATDTQGTLKAFPQ